MIYNIMDLIYVDCKKCNTTFDTFFRIEANKNQVINLKKKILLKKKISLTI